MARNRRSIDLVPGNDPRLSNGTVDLSTKIARATDHGRYFPLTNGTDLFNPAKRRASLNVALIRQWRPKLAKRVHGVFFYGSIWRRKAILFPLYSPRELERLPSILEGRFPLHYVIFHYNYYFFFLHRIDTRNVHILPLC